MRNEFQNDVEHLTHSVWVLFIIAPPAFPLRLFLLFPAALTHPCVSIFTVWPLTLTCVHAYGLACSHLNQERLFTSGLAQSQGCNDKERSIRIDSEKEMNSYSLETEGGADAVFWGICFYVCLFCLIGFLHLRQKIKGDLLIRQWNDIDKYFFCSFSGLMIKKSLLSTILTLKFIFKNLVTPLIFNIVFPITDNKYFKFHF